MLHDRLECMHEHPLGSWLSNPVSTSHHEVVAAMLCYRKVRSLTDLSRFDTFNVRVTTREADWRIRCIVLSHLWEQLSPCINDCGQYTRGLLGCIANGMTAVLNLLAKTNHPSQAPFCWTKVFHIEIQWLAWEYLCYLCIRWQLQADKNDWCLFLKHRKSETNEQKYRVKLSLYKYTSTGVDEYDQS
jgi:hypothetical protein